MDALELCNKINMEAESLADSGFPLEVFSQKRLIKKAKNSRLELLF